MTTTTTTSEPNELGGQQEDRVAEVTPAALAHAPLFLARKRLQARSGWVALDLRELWAYRELLAFQALRDIKVRYQQTALGAAWAVLQPVTQMVIFSVFFGKLLGVGSDGVPYPVFAYCALLPWQLFAFALTQSSNSLVDNAHLITKVYFPRLVVPLASVIAGLVDFCIAFVVLLGLMFWYGITPTWAVVTLPLFVTLAVMVALAAGLWLSAMNVQYRDVRYTLPFIAQIMFFLTPIVYPSSRIPEQYRWIVGLNPMAGVVEGFRWALLGNVPPPGSMLAVSVGMTFLLLLGGLYYFRRMERGFADVV
jgi:lipopolysaccharide transport system permease protein